ncbi:thymidylate kinase [Roseiarcus fermentans]|uniref:Thymidylate kinase n=1 Tax=Roseiarcus fermentans TaxID=1473586 RepID=A0A366FQB8_9HYPH|nr:dTMP kinase [Roseiarcus fermentans]RBP16883.1 thymidylate kinase [Roseiarcus fermentans]
MSGRGRFITLEGGEGAGKSVQARRLERRLSAAGLEVVRTREPGGSPHAEALRAVILSGFAKAFGPEGEALLFAAARIDHLDQTILPALRRGAWVVSDRFADSTRAYQGAAGDLPAEWIARLEAVAVGPNRPDLTLILDLPAEAGLARAGFRRGAGQADRFEAEGTGFHETLRRAYLEIAADEPGRCVVIDALASEDAVEAAVWRAVEARLDPQGAARAAR